MDVRYPIITSLPESLANGTSLTGGGSVCLEVNIPQPIASPLKATPPKPEREENMTMEVRSLLSWATLDMSGHVSGNSTPKRPNPMVILTHPPHKLRDLSGLVDTSSQVSTLNDTEMAEASPEEVPTTISPIAETPGSRSGTPPADTSHL